MVVALQRAGTGAFKSGGAQPQSGDEWVALGQPRKERALIGRLGRGLGPLAGPSIRREQ